MTYICRVAPDFSEKTSGEFDDKNHHHIVLRQPFF